MGRALDGAALKAELLRGGVVVNRGVDLRMEHLLRAPPRPEKRVVVLRYVRIKRRRCHPLSLSLCCQRFKEARFGQGPREYMAVAKVCLAAMDEGCPCIAKSVHAVCKQDRLQQPAGKSADGEQKMALMEVGLDDKYRLDAKRIFLSGTRRWSGSPCCSADATARRD
jgi:hypothetical protein